MLRKLTVEDFAVLKEPLESGRQSPSSLGGTLVLAALFQCLMFYLTYSVAAGATIFPNVEMIKKIHFWFTAILVACSIIYAIPAVYKRGQKVQYLIVILMSQNIAAVMTYLSAMFLLGNSEGITAGSLLTVTYVTLGAGVLIFIATSIRFYILLKKGGYRKGSKRDELRGNLEQIIKSNFLSVIIGSVGIGYIIQYLFRFAHFDDEGAAFIIVLSLLIFFTMLFVLPEQLVILYCKCRFRSFNFNRRGYLESEDQDRKNDKKFVH